MIIALQSTTKTVEFNGVPARLWEGRTKSGVKVHAFITRIAVDADDEAANEEFERELASCAPPTPEIAKAYPAKLIL